MPSAKGRQPIRPLRTGESAQPLRGVELEVVSLQDTLSVPVTVSLLVYRRRRLLQNACQVAVKFPRGREYTSLEPGLPRILRGRIDRSPCHHVMSSVTVAKQKCISCETCGVKEGGSGSVDVLASDRGLDLAGRTVTIQVPTGTSDLFIVERA